MFRMFHQHRSIKNGVCFKNALISFFRDRMRKNATFFDMACKIFEYHSTVRGISLLKRILTLDCLQEKDNPFKFFAAKVME